MITATIHLDPPDEYTVTENLVVFDRSVALALDYFLHHLRLLATLETGAYPDELLPFYGGNRPEDHPNDPGYAQRAMREDSLALLSYVHQIMNLDDQAERQKRLLEMQDWVAYRERRRHAAE